ncbi:MAG: YciI family protein [Actinomycetota bacterium]
MELDRYSFVLLRRGPRALEFSEAELEGLQEQHLAHLAAMREQGVLVLAGPFSDQPDESLRGFCLYNTDVEETRRLAESDQSVQAGRMAADVMSWWTERGSIGPLPT